MADDNRVDLDSFDDIGTVKKNLLDDVAAVKDLKEKQKVKEEQEKAQSKNRTLMLIIVIAAAIMIFGAAYWWVFVKNSAPEVTQPTIKPPVANPVPTYRANPTTTVPGRVTVPGTSPRPAPRSTCTPSKPSGPPSVPVRRNPSDTYDEGPSSGGM
jgi:cytoskeletal protein RodZ